MLDALTLSPKAGPDFSAAVSDLLRSTSRALIVTVAGICCLWYGATILVPPWRGGIEPVFYATVTLLAVSGVAWWLLEKRLLAAQAIWLLGLAGVVTLTSYLFQSAEVAAAYLLLPLLATLIAGPVIGLLAEGLVLVLTAIQVWGWVATPLDPAYGFTFVVAGAFVGILGWVATRALLTVTQWSLDSFQQARERMDEAFDQQLELKQTQEDLLQVNNELARLTDRLKVMQRMADEARQAKEEFVANVSHELRTPLNMIIGFSEIITRSPQIYGGDVPQSLLADITTIQRNSQHLARLVNDVLDLSQVDAGRMALSKAWVDVGETIESALAVVRPLYDSKHLSLSSEIQPDLPRLFCDGTRVRQVIINLLSNAGRFTRQGGVKVSAGRLEGEVVIGVADTGPGISAEDQQRLFEPFQQLDASIRRRHGGSGLGLSISKRFVELHGGRIWVESPSSVHAGGGGGPGTYIRFTLPIETDATPSLDYNDARRWFSPYYGTPDTLRTRRSKAPAPTVLPHYVVLEEANALAVLLQRYMSRADIEVVATPTEAVHALARSPADALIINAAESSASASQVLQLADLPFSTPVLSCWVPGSNEELRRLGAQRYLVKPISADTLLAALAEVGPDARRILIVDDELEALQLFSRIISSEHPDREIIRALTGERALQLLRSRHPDVMLLDLVMPGVDGFQVLREKAADPSTRAIPVIITSSRDPAGGPIISDALAATKGEGLSVRELVDGIQMLSELLAPSARAERQGSPTGPPG